MKHCIIAVGLTMVSLISGCTTSPSPRYYVAAPGEGWQTIATRDAAASDMVIRIAPVRLPAYLDRPQIVTRISESEIKPDQFHRWGIPLEATVTEVLGASMGQVLSRAYIDVMPVRGRSDQDFQVHVDIVRLDGYLGGTVDLIVQWSVRRTDESGASPIQRVAHYQETAIAKTYDAYVDAVRLTLAAMGREIAAVIEALPQPTP